MCMYRYMYICMCMSMSMIRATAATSRRKAHAVAYKVLRRMTETRGMRTLTPMRTHGHLTTRRFIRLP